MTSGPRSSHIPIRGYILVFAFLWSAIIVALVVWNIRRHDSDMMDLARHEAVIAYEKDVLMRRWAANHGGVYVPVSEDTPPNPYLWDVPERDITTPSGRRLTLMNPAYITRQLHELQNKYLGTRGHITSLRPIRAENSPDEWETRALQGFERGLQEVASVERMEGREYMRLMRPLITEESCLKCHATQGYRVGEIRGGISVAVPMQPIVSAGSSYRTHLVFGYGLIWLLGMGMLGVGYSRLGKQVLARERAEEALRAANETLEQRIKERVVELETAIKMLTTEIDERTKAEERFRTLIEEAPTAIRISREGKTIYANPKYLKIYGIENVDDIRDRPITNQVAPEFRQEIAERSRLREDGLIAPATYETVGLRRDGSRFPVLVAATRVVLKEGLATISFITDITELRMAEEALRRLNEELEQRVAERTAELEKVNLRLERMAGEDGLTGLANRRQFNTVLDAEIRRARRRKNYLALLMCDVDFFKPYNDHYGHVAGDRCLQTIAQVLKKLCRRAGQLPTRYGGEEFAVILPGSAPEEAGNVAEKLRQAIIAEGLPHQYSKAATVVTVSIGVVSVVASAETTVEWFIKQADDALYQSKEEGRNRVTCVSRA